MQFEVHFTFSEKVSPKTLVEVGEQWGYHYSAIEHDELYGPGVKRYLTKTYFDVTDMMNHSMQVLHHLVSEGLMPMRMKRELTLDDIRYTP